MAWLKGQTHLHSDRSGDSRTPPEVVVRWYAEHGYDFIVFTDHNVVTRPRPSPRPTMLVLSGAELTWNAPTCGPPTSPCNLHLNALFATAPPDDRTVTLSPTDPGDRASVFAAELAQRRLVVGIHADQPQTAGSYLFEPVASVHTLECPATNTEDTVVLFRVSGANVNFTEDGQFHSVLDAAMIVHLTGQLAEAQQLGPLNYISGGAAGFNAEAH